MCRDAANFIRGSARLEAVGTVSGALFQHPLRQGHPLLAGGAGGCDDGASDRCPQPGRAGTGAGKALPVRGAPGGDPRCSSFPDGVSYPARPADRHGHQPSGGAGALPVRAGHRHHRQHLCPGGGSPLRAERGRTGTGQRMDRRWTSGQCPTGCCWRRTRLGFLSVNIRGIRAEVVVRDAALPPEIEPVGQVQDLDRPQRRGG